MDRVKKSLENLIEAIKNSREFQEFQKAKNEVEKDPEKKSNLDKYRTRICDIQNQYGSGDLYYMVDQLENEAEIFRSDPVVDNFLTTELAFCRMIQNINWTLIQELDFDVNIVHSE